MKVKILHKKIEEHSKKELVNIIKTYKNKLNDYETIVGKYENRVLLHNHIDKRKKLIDKAERNYYICGFGIVYIFLYSTTKNILLNPLISIFVCIYCLYAVLLAYRMIRYNIYLKSKGL